MYTYLFQYDKNCVVSSVQVCLLHCVNINSTQLWDTSTGMVLADFKGHTNSVTCCALSATGKLVTSSSEDCTVKVIP